MIMPTQIRITENRRQELVAATARAHQITAATRPAPTPECPPAGRVRRGLRQAIASLVALAFVV